MNHLFVTNFVEMAYCMFQNHAMTVIKLLMMDARTVQKTLVLHALDQINLLPMNAYQFVEIVSRL